MRRVVVVGGSVAATTTVDALRQEGHEGPITVISEETEPPYARPPLSKAVLSGRDEPSIATIPFTDPDTELRLGVAAVGLDAASKEVRLANGESVRYEGLVIAAGARARSLAAPGQNGEFRLRTMADTVRLRSALLLDPLVVIVGGGFLGFEIASICRENGLDVSIVSRRSLLMGGLGRVLADLLTEAARDGGAEIVVSSRPASLTGDATVTGVRISSGRELSGDMVITTVGCEPNVEWLSSAGLASPAGLIVDNRCRVLPDVVAAGDIAAMHSGPGGSLQRKPHWANAIGQARVAAAALLHGDAAPAYRPDPYLWTEGFGIDLKLAGRFPPPGEPIVIDGSLAERRVLLQWCDADGPASAAAINYRIPVPRLKRLARRHTPEAGDGTGPASESTRARSTTTALPAPSRTSRDERAEPVL